MAGHLQGFLLAVCAGMATTLGVAFIPLLRYGEQAHARVTAVALAFAAGVMLYVSFTDATDEAKEDFEKELGEGNIAVRLYFALFFFAGIAVAVGLDRLFPEGGGDGAPKPKAGAEEVELGERAGAADARPSQQRAEALVCPDGLVERQASTGSSMARVSLVTFLAMTVHNFPEGVAVFSDGAGGKWLLAVAIALHNIPEGAAVAIPTYQTSQSFPRAFAMTFISGLAQPLGAGVTWAILAACDVKLEEHHCLMGAAKAITAGIMVCISLLELLPEALRGVSPLAVALTMVAAFLTMEGTIILLEVAKK